MDLNSIIAAIAAHNWLALLMLVALYLRTLFSSKSAFPFTLPPNWQPIFVALAGAVVTTVTGLEAGKAIGAALLLGAVGLVAGGFLDGLLVAFFGSPANVPSWAKLIVGIIDEVVGPGGGSASRSGGGASSSSANGPRPPAAARVGGLRWAFAAVAVALMLSFTQVSAHRVHDGRSNVVLATGAGCGWLTANTNTVTTDIAALASCVLAEVLGGTTNPLVVTGKCVGTTMSSLEQIVASLIAYYEQQAESDAGVTAGLRCGAGDPPFKGITPCLAASAVAKLHELHGATKARLAAGEK